jgi:hypothetical protein
MSDAAANIIACLGPEGSFSHLITQKRFPDVAVSLRDNIGDVFDFLSGRPDAQGIVPIENSSGGFIIDTVDRLLDARCHLSIMEELTLDVKLALLGRPGQEVRTTHMPSALWSPVRPRLLKKLPPRPVRRPSARVKMPSGMRLASCTFPSPARCRTSRNSFS